MKISRSGVTVAMLAGLLSITAALPAQAQNGRMTHNQRQQVMDNYCDNNRNDRDCRDYRGGRWDDRDYDRFYNQRRSGMDSIASGLFGLTFGAIVGGAIANGNNSNNNGGGDRVVGRANGNSSHEAACAAQYRSYDVRSDTYTGFDGRKHQCNL